MSNEPAPLHITEPDNPNVGMIVAFVLTTCVLVIIVILMVQPFGLFGEREIVRV